MNAQEVKELEQAIEQMYEIAHRFGLDYYDMRFELVPADVLYTFGAYSGMPTRFSHWSFGKSYHRMKMDYDFGLSRIYELVINSDPCYAFLLDSNSLVQNKLVSAHVLGHCDFFKNNAMFAYTPRNIVDSMAASAERFRSYEVQFGKQAVEEFLDAALAVQEHIDPSHARMRRPQGEGWEWGEGRQSEGKGSSGRAGGVRGMRTGHVGAPAPEANAGRYADLFALDERLGNKAHASTGDAVSSQSDGSTDGALRKPTLEKDLLLYLIHNSKVLTEWQRDILTVIREEMLYFWPQIETKIMNEGWASYCKGAFLSMVDETSFAAVIQVIRIPFGCRIFSTSTTMKSIHLS